MKEYPKMYKDNSTNYNMSSKKIGNGVMGHASKVYEINPIPNRDNSKIKEIKSYYSNTPSEAFNYDY